MYSLKATIKALSFIGAIVLAAATSEAVSPPPDGGYPNQNTDGGYSVAQPELATASGGRARSYFAS